MDVNSLSAEAKQQIQQHIGVNVDELIAAMNVILHPPAGADVLAADATIQAARDALAHVQDQLDAAEQAGHYDEMAGLEDPAENLNQLLDDYDQYEEPAPAGNESAAAAGGKRRKTIRRKAYSRKGYTRKSGVHVKGSKVHAAMIRDVGHPGKGVLGTGKPGIGPLKKGELESVGYHRTAKASSRHRALNKAIKKYGSLSTYRKLNAVAVYTKRTSPSASKTFKADRDWVGKKRS